MSERINLQRAWQDYRAAQERYEQLRAINWSSLKNIATSPLFYRWRLSNPQPTKPAFVFGGAVHCAILEPETFDQRYALFEGTRRGEEWREWQAAHPGVESLKPPEMERVRRCAEAVIGSETRKGHRVAVEILRGGRREEALTWIDPETGIACKGRVDYIRPDFVVELKSTRDPSPARFERDAFKYGYGGQTMFYDTGAATKRLIPGTERPFIVSVQNVGPFDVAVFQLDQIAVNHGRALDRVLLKKLAICTESDFWPGCAPDLVPLSLPEHGQGMSIEEPKEDF